MTSEAYELTVAMLEDLLVTAGVSASEHGTAIRKTASALVYKIGVRLSSEPQGEPSEFVAVGFEGGLTFALTGENAGHWVEGRPTHAPIQAEPSERCTYCGQEFPLPVSLHHAEHECVQGEPSDAVEAVRRLKAAGVGAYMILAAVTNVYDMETKS